MQPDAPQVQLHVPRLLWAALVVVGGVALVLAVVVILQLEDTRRTIDDRLATRVGAVERSTVALSRDLRSHDAGRQIEASGDLSRNLLGADAGRQLRRAGALSTNLLGVDAGRQITTSADLARTLLRAGVGPATADVRQLSADVAAADLPALSAGLASADLPALSQAVLGVTDELGAQDRLERLLFRLVSVLGEARTTEMVPKVAAAADDFRRTVVPLLRELRDINEETRDITRDTNAITRDTNGHTESLDRKLGGELPTP